MAPSTTASSSHGIRPLRQQHLGELRQHRLVEVAAGRAGGGQGGQRAASGWGGGPRRGRRSTGRGRSRPGAPAPAGSGWCAGRRGRRRSSRAGRRCGRRPSAPAGSRRSSPWWGRARARRPRCGSGAAGARGERAVADDRADTAWASALAVGSSRRCSISDRMAFTVCNIATDLLCHQRVGTYGRTMTGHPHLPLDRRPPRAPARSGRTGPVFNPATGAQTGEVDLASAAEVDAAVAKRHRGRRASGARPRCRERSARALRVPRAARTSRTDELAAIITAEHGKVLSDAAGEIARGLENVEFATRRAAACSRAASPSRPPPASTSTRSASRSASSPASRPSTSRPWCRCGCAPTRSPCGNAFILKPSEKDPSAALFLARLWKEAGLPDGVFTVVHGDKEAVDAILEPPRHRRGELRRLDPDRPVHLRDRHRATASGSRPSAARRTTCWSCPTPTSTWPPTRSSRRPTARPASAAWRSPSPWPSATSPTRWSTPSPRACPSSRIGDGADPDTDMGPLITREHRDKVAGYIGRASEAGATVVVDGREARRARRTASSSARRCSTTSPPR